MSIEHEASNTEPGMKPPTLAAAPSRLDQSCRDCSGSGHCAICDGSGIIAKQNEFERLQNVACESCSGEGVCPACGGTGVVERT